MTAANMFTPERRPIDSRGSGKSAVGNGLLSVQAFSWCQNVPKRPSRRPNTRSVEMACLQEWDADRRQAAHAEKSLAVRELVRLSLRVQSTGVVAELHLDTALVAPSGSGADHERRIRRGCQATDGRADNWRGVLNNARACSTAARRSLRPRLLYALCHSPPHWLRGHSPLAVALPHE